MCLEYRECLESSDLRLVVPVLPHPTLRIWTPLQRHMFLVNSARRRKLAECSVSALDHMRLGSWMKLDEVG